MRARSLLALLLLHVPTVPANGAGALRPIRVANAGAVRKGRNITLEKAAGGYGAVGLWTEKYDLPGRPKVRAIRLAGLKLPRGGKCDIITQARYAAGAGKWTEWTPANVLANGDFRAGAPKGGRLTTNPGGPPGLRRFASAPTAKTGPSIPFWRAVATPGAEVTFAASVLLNMRKDGRPAPQPRKTELGLSAGFNDAAGKPLARTTMKTWDPGAKSWRRLAVGMSVPRNARTFEGRAEYAVGRTIRLDGASVWVAGGVLTFEDPAVQRRALVRADFSDTANWAARGGPIEWTGGGRPAASLVVNDTHGASGAVSRRAARFKHRGWAEVRATVSLRNASAAVTVLFLDAAGKLVTCTHSLRCDAGDGTYRIWGRGAVPARAVAARLVFGAARRKAKTGRATFHSIELAACDPVPPFRPRPPVDVIRFPRPVQAAQLEIRSFLLSADPKFSASFAGYVIETE